jgi:hypothetical protein
MLYNGFAACFEKTMMYNSEMIRNQNSQSPKRVVGVWRIATSALHADAGGRSWWRYRQLSAIRSGASHLTYLDHFDIFLSSQARHWVRLGIRYFAQEVIDGCLGRCIPLKRLNEMTDVSEAA